RTIADPYVIPSFPTRRSSDLGDAFGSSSADTFRVHPLNPDLLLVSAEWLKPPAGVPTDTHTGGGLGFFLYEIRSKRRTLVSPSKDRKSTRLNSSHEWISYAVF